MWIILSHDVFCQSFGCLLTALVMSGKLGLCAQLIKWDFPRNRDGNGSSVEQRLHPVQVDPSELFDLEVL